MKVYFEYLNWRGHTIGYSDDIIVNSLNEATRRANVVIKQVSEIYTVIIREAETDEELNRQGI